MIPPKERDEKDKVQERDSEGGRWGRGVVGGGKGRAGRWAR